MFKFFKKWITATTMELDMKIKVYSYAKEFFTNYDEIIVLFQKLYAALKDVPVEQLQNELISKVAEYAHEEATKERENTVEK